MDDIGSKSTYALTGLKMNLLQRKDMVSLMFQHKVVDQAQAASYRALLLSCHHPVG
jgi:hypothetical protein